MGDRDHAPDGAPGPPTGPPAAHNGDASVAPGGPSRPGAAEDAAWVESARSGDSDAFGRLFDRWFDPVYDVAWRIVRNRDTAAEVAQDVFLVAWQGLDRLEQPGSFGGWVRRIARNRALNRLDRERRSRPDDEAAVAALDRSAADVDMTAALGERDQAELVWAAASALGERDASLLDLHLRHGFGAPEIADEIGVTANNAHQLLHRLKGKLAGAIRAWVLWRAAGGRRCPELERAIEGAGVSSFGAEAVRVIGRHAGGCAACTEQQQLRLAPEALFAAMPIMIAPPALKAQAAAALESAGVSMSGSTATSGPAGPEGAEAGGRGSGGPEGGGEGSGGPRNAGDADPAVQDAAADETAADEAAPDETATFEVIDGAGAPPAGGTRSLLLRRPVLGGLVAAALLVVLGLGALLWADGRGQDPGPTEVADARRFPDDRLRAGPGAGTTTPSSQPGTTDGPTTTPGAVQPPPTEPPTATPPVDEPPTTDPGTTSPPSTEPEGVEPPVIEYFRLEAGGPCRASVGQGVAVTLYWSSTRADSAVLTAPGGSSRAVDTAGQITGCSGPGEFVLTVTGPGGEATAAQAVPAGADLAVPPAVG